MADTDYRNVRAVRELRAAGYVVIAPDELDSVELAIHWSTCGCGGIGIEQAQALAADPRDVIGWKLGTWAQALQAFSDLVDPPVPASSLGPPWRRGTHRETSSGPTG